MVGAPSFSQSYLCIKLPLKSSPKIGSSTSDNFHLFIPPLLVRKIILTIPIKTPFLQTSSTVHLSTICTKICSQSQPFSRCRLRHEPGSQGVLQTVITGLATTDSLSLRLRELVYSNQQSLIKMLAIRMSNHPIHLLSYPQPIVITSILH